MMTRTVMLCVVALLLLVDVGGKMWGSRRKKEVVEEEYEETVDPLQAARAKLNSRHWTAARITRQKTENLRSRRETGEALLHKYIDVFDRALSGNDLDKYLSPEAIQNIQSMIPEKERSSPDYEPTISFFNSPERKNIEGIKASMKELVSVIRTIVPQVVELLSQAVEMLSGGPEVVLEAMQALVMKELAPDSPTRGVDMRFHISILAFIAQFEYTTTSLDRASTTAGGSFSENLGSPREIGEALLHKYIDMFETVLCGNSFDQYISPEALQNMLSMIPEEELSSPEIKQILNLPELQDMDVLKASMKEVVSTMRLYVPQVVEVLSQVVEVLSGGPEVLIQTMREKIPGEVFDIAISSQIYALVSFMTAVNTTDTKLLLNKPHYK